MTAEGHNVDEKLMSLGRDHGHYFVKKTFGKPTYCHHCCDKIWGMLSQGFVCEGMWKSEKLNISKNFKSSKNLNFLN